MYSRNKKRKYLKPDQRVQIWSHGLKEAMHTFTGGGISCSLKNHPQRAPTEDNVQTWLSSPETKASYQSLLERVRSLSKDDRPKSTPQDDCFALFALTKAVNAERALEIGTHLGYSTLHIAAALSRTSSASKLTTVDLIDVNDDEKSHYRSFGENMSAIERLRALGFEDRVEFIVGPSTDFLKNTQDTFDVIFIDGDHSEVGAYFDIVNSLHRLRENGIIILHDYYDPNVSTIDAAAGQFGVYWALERLKKRIPNVSVIPLCNILPPSRESLPPTSLAILTRIPSNA